MARQYSALFKAPKPSGGGYIKERTDGQWSVIYQDYNDDAWYIHLDDAENEETAKEIAEAMNLREKKRRDVNFFDS